MASPHRFFFFFLLPSIVFGGNSGNRRPSDFLRSTDQPVRAARRFLTRNLVLRRFPHGVIFSLGRPSVATLHRRARAASLFFSNPKQKKHETNRIIRWKWCFLFLFFICFFLVSGDFFIKVDVADCDGGVGVAGGGAGGGRLCGNGVSLIRLLSFGGGTLSVALLVDFLLLLLLFHHHHHLLLLLLLLFLFWSAGP